MAGDLPKRLCYARPAAWAAATLLSFCSPLSAQSAGPLEPRRPPVENQQLPAWELTGVLISMLPDSIELEVVGGARIVCQRADQTAYATSAGEFFPGDRIAVDSLTGPDAGCVAEWVGRPEQRYREAAAVRSERGPEGQLTPTPETPDDPLLARAEQVNRGFSLAQPDFICRQTITRSTSRNLGKKWRELDVVGADVILVDGVEEYRAITRNGRPTGVRRMSSVGGTWSTGEYSSILWNLFAPESATEYEAAGEDEIRGLPAVVYRYSIDQERSRWHIQINGERYAPAHSGRFWLDQETARVLRVEMEATYFPPNYRLAKAETTVDFATVEIRGKEYLLPIEARALGCFRYSAQCDLNRIEFTDYRKFETDSSVYHTSSEIDFGEGAESSEDAETGEGGGPR